MLLIIGWAERAWPWGDLGHKVMRESAFQELNDKARREVVRLAYLLNTSVGK